MDKICCERSLGIAVEVILLVILLLVGGAAAVPVEGWNRTFGGMLDEVAHSVQQTSDGGYIFAGYSGKEGSTEDIWLVKTDTNGNKQWEKTFGGDDRDIAYSVQQTKDGGYIIGGYTQSYGAGNGDFWQIKTDANGNKQWEKTFGGSAPDRAYSVQQTSDDGYILAGFTMSAGLADFWLVKTDVNGNQQWDKRFGGTDVDIAKSVQQTSDGGYILAGYTKSYGAGDRDVWLIKTDANGNEQWSKTFGGLGFDIAFAVQQTKDRGYIISAYTYSDEPSRSFWLIKTDADGNKQWDKTFGTKTSLTSDMTMQDDAYSVQQSKDNGYIIAGYTSSDKSDNNDFWVIKVDANGNKQWEKTFGGTKDDKAYSVQQTADNGYIIAGYTYSYGAGKKDAWLIKVSGEPIDTIQQPTTTEQKATPSQQSKGLPGFEAFYALMVIVLIIAVKNNRGKW